MEMDNLQLQEKVAFYEDQEGAKDAKLRKLEAKLKVESDEKVET